MLCKFKSLQINYKLQICNFVNHCYKLIDTTGLTNQVALLSHGEQGILVLIHSEGMIAVAVFY